MRKIYVLLLFFCSLASAHETQSGVQYSIDYTSEIQTNLEKVKSANLIEAHFTCPLGERLTLDFGSISTFSSSQEEMAYDLQGFSNIDNFFLPFALNMAGLSVNMGEGGVLFAGVRGVDADYFCTDGLSFFTNSSCGVLPTLSLNHDIAIFPNAAPGIHYMKERDKFRFQASLYNGYGHHELFGEESVFCFRPKRDGLLALSEIKYNHGSGQCYLGGSLRYYGSNENKLSAGAWIYAEEKLSEKFTLITVYSQDFSRDALCRNYAGLGGIYDTGKASLGLYANHASFEDMHETALEAICSIPVTRWLSLQPILHLISHPGNLCAVGVLRICVEL